MAQRSKVFISYRRDDAKGDARSIYQAMQRSLGSDARLFMDVDDIQQGHDFREALEQCLAETAVMLVLIGEKWLGLAGPGGARRIDDPADFVRLEIATALRDKIRLIPVLLDNATMPDATALPEDISEIAFRQASRLRHDSFSTDMIKLQAAVKQALRGSGARAGIRGGKIAAALLLAALAVGGGYLYWGSRQPAAPTTADSRAQKDQGRETGRTVDAAFQASLINRLFLGECVLRKSASELAAVLKAIRSARSRSLDKGAAIRIEGILKRIGVKQSGAAYASRSWVSPPADWSGEGGGAFGGAPSSGSAPSAPQGGYLPNCIQFVRGEFAEPGASVDAPPAPGFSPDEWERIKADFRAIGAEFAATPQILFEAEIIVSWDLTQYRLEPQYLSYGGALGSDLRTKERGLFIEFAINAAPRTMRDSSASVGVLPIGNFSIGDHVRYTLSPDGVADARSPNMNWVQVGEESIGGKAVNVEIRLIEVHDARPVLDALNLVAIGETYKASEKPPDAIRSSVFPNDSDAIEKLHLQGTSAAELSKALAKIAALQTEQDALEAQASAKPNDETLKRLVEVKRVEIDIERSKAAVHAKRAGISLPDL